MNTYKNIKENFNQIKKCKEPFKKTIGNIAGFNNKYNKTLKTKNKYIEVLEFNKEDIITYIIPEMKSYNIEEEFPIDKWINKYNLEDEIQSKIIDYNLGTPVNFKADILGKNEIDIAIPYCKDNNPEPFIKIKVPKIKIEMARYAQLKVIFNTNKVDIKEEIEVQDNYFIYKLTSRPYKTSSFWKTFHTYIKYGLRIKDLN